MQYLTTIFFDELIAVGSNKFYYFAMNKKPQN